MVYYRFFFLSSFTGNIGKYSFVLLVNFKLQFQDGNSPTKAVLWVNGIMVAAS